MFAGRTPDLAVARSRAAARVAGVFVAVSALLVARADAVPAAPSPVPTRPSVAPAADYRIAAGDVLQVFVWKEPELTRDATVRQDGKISVPLLGDVIAMNRTPEQLAADMAAGLKRYLTAPQVTVGVKEANAARFFVIGKVAKPGAFPLLGRTTLLQALAIGGGLQEFAKAERIVIVREERGVQGFVTLNYKKLEAGSDISQNVVLQPGDTIVVP